MKYRVVFVLTVLVIMYSIACKKESADKNSSSIVGKWNIINDSIFLEGTPFFPGSASNYIGTATDYFDFHSNGDLYVRKGNEFDTGSYTMPASDQVTIVYYSLNGASFGSTGAIRGTYTIAYPKKNNITLTLSGITPEGEGFELIRLSK